MTDAQPEDPDAQDEDDAAEDDEDAFDAQAEGIPQDMVELLEETADLDDPVEVTAGPDGTTYLIGGRPFAWASGLVFEAQLGPDIASAALRTPSVVSSSRGPGWVRLAPVIIEDHAADRVVAWFEMARRIAAGRILKPDGSNRH